MPFDSAPTKPVGRDVAAEAVALVDRMAGLLARPEQWCKNSLWNGRAWCLYGALNTVAHGHAYVWNGNEVAGTPQNAVHVAMSHEANKRLVARSSYAAVEFNNAHERTHADIIDFLKSVKARLEEDVHAV